MASMCSAVHAQKHSSPACPVKVILSEMSGRGPNLDHPEGINSNFNVCQASKSFPIPLTLVLTFLQPRLHSPLHQCSHGMELTLHPVADPKCLLQGTFVPLPAACPHLRFCWDMSRNGDQTPKGFRKGELVPLLLIVPLPSLGLPPLAMVPTLFLSCQALPLLPNPTDLPAPLPMGMSLAHDHSHLQWQSSHAPFCVTFCKCFL